MERLKTELLMIGKDVGDIGTTEQQQRWIGHFFEGLRYSFTEEGLQTFSAEQLRPAYVAFVHGYGESRSLADAIEQVIYLFHPSDKCRPIVQLKLPDALNVVSIFQKNS